MFDFLHITGSVLNRVCGEYEAAVPPVYIFIVLTVILRWPLLEGAGVLIKWHGIHLISCCLSPITHFSPATSGACGQIIQLGLGIQTRYTISFIIRISQTMEYYAPGLSVSYLF